MGCGASNSRADPYMVKVNETWTFALRTVDRKKFKRKSLVVKRYGWKTVRIFVSSTFKDFHAEREVLVKKVFPDLRVWCEARRLHLIECDLRWGVPKDATSEITLRACLGEIDRCYNDNIMPFFINMTSERMGWVPLGHEIPDTVKEQYTWVEGLSVTEMEIMHGAYRKDNPNALFLLREPSFLDRTPEEHRKIFIDNSPLAPAKLSILRKMIKDRFPDERVKYYQVEFLGINPDSGLPELDGLDGTFSNAVFEFFKKRIAEQYPLMNMEEQDPFLTSQEQHESFMKNRSESVLGRDPLIQQISAYVDGIAQDTPYVLLGGAGSGKSSVMARVADVTCSRALAGEIPGARGKEWHVFYHFVGAVPGSTELLPLLRRFLKETGVCNNDNMPADMDTAAQLVCGALNNPSTRPCVIIIDAVNQLDEDKAAELMTWVPRKLAPHIRCVFSMIPDTPCHKALLSREPLPKMLHVTPLDIQAKKEIVTVMLGKYNKALDEEQLQSLISKTSADNPLWLSIACEELRIFGQFRQVSDKINRLADGLLELEMQVLQRFEKENGGQLLVATLCLLEVSAGGLLESELLSILGDEDCLMPLSNDEAKEKGGKDDKDREKSKKDIEKLPAYKWAEVYRALKPFLRPFGDSGEGRLDFYHRSLSKAIRRMYFLDEDGNPKADVYYWWHYKLADFFEDHSNLGRRIEEYPLHLIEIKDAARLQKFLVEWEVFDQLYDLEYSNKLLQYWRKGSDFDELEIAYVTQVANYANQENCDRDLLCQRYEKVSRFLVQAGRYRTSDTMLEMALKLETEELGSRTERLVELYYMSALLADEEMKQEEFMYRSQLPKIRTIIESFEKSADLRRTMSGRVHKLKLGMTLNRMAFYYSGYSLRGGDSWLSATDAKTKGMEAVNECIDIFKELNDDYHRADALTTKGVVIGTATPEQIKNYEEALSTLLPLVGELNTSVDRLYLNIAIYHEEVGDYYKAYDYFYKWYVLCINLYGPQHPKSLRPVNTLKEPVYQRLAQELGNPVPGLTN